MPAPAVYVALGQNWDSFSGPDHLKIMRIIVEIVRSNNRPLNERVIRVLRKNLREVETLLVTYPGIEPLPTLQTDIEDQLAAIGNNLITLYSQG